MVMEKFSDSLSVYKNDLENSALRDSLKSLDKLIGGKVKILDWGNSKIAIPLEINVDLPSLGNFENLDIRTTEPIILVFDLINYPVSAPRVYTDRSDFPKSNLAHLYVAVNNRPPAFCYVRGNPDEWYANKRIEDLLIRISNWLHDAATGELAENGDQYEPLRLEGYSGNIIYDYDTILSVVTSKTALVVGENFSIALFEQVGLTNRSTYKFVKLITDKNALATIKEVDEERKKGKEDVSRRKYFFGFILWNEENEIKSEYQVNIPRSFEEFKLFCNYYEIKYEEFEKFVATFKELNEYIYFPVIVAIRRPSQLTGYSSNIEFINLRFKLDSDDVKDETIVNNISIDILSHNQPLTQKLARQISGRKIDLSGRSAVFGCGAIGSKIIMHLARSGQTNLTLIDPDYISPHNLVRHVLFSDNEGENKAEALAQKIRKFYPFEMTGVINGPSFKEGLIDKEETFKTYNWLLDFTASEAFFNKLVMLKSINNNQLASASISDFGNLGILYKEGANRNPRIDDLQVELYSLASTDENIHKWLQNEQLAASSNNLVVQVGVGCNSETTILSDDKISSHASYFSGVLKKEMENLSSQGKIYLNRILDTGDYKIETEIIKVDPFDIFQPVNDSTWTIRFKSGVIKQLTDEFRNAGKIETGGVFVGVCNYKTKTIHVTESIKAPIDSEGNSIHFIRGYKGLPEKISEVETKSGGQIGYIGEWHTHPDGPNFLSPQDMKSVQCHKEETDKLQPPLPVFLSIITPDGIFPYIF
ncbi:JAB domain-containing protein similar to deubiquitination enzymes [Flavobacterium lindanitolerans]|uniref:JAB domain-containing protein similar to deubiquitination enzymes n=2 Tax=Flavobacterium lindanitolerans TaxID=428988 RepID=A0A497UHB1_9FLAO|nr:JAB domain-containing protein similar to deubiquitination enzymes [Flavobacterium lindanitolerans]RLJ30270.1 JAB domain-containing protein similar to deubiquitination enzymes [Flavobacterium lindanitolerans]